MISNYFIKLLYQENTLSTGNTVLNVFDPVTVEISIDKTNIQHQKMKLELIKPYVSILYTVFYNKLLLYIYYYIFDIYKYFYILNTTTD